MVKDAMESTYVYTMHFFVLWKGCEQIFVVDVFLDISTYFESEYTFRHYSMCICQFNESVMKSPSLAYVVHSMFLYIACSNL